MVVLSEIQNRQMGIGTDARVVSSTVIQSARWFKRAEE